MKYIICCIQQRCSLDPDNGAQYAVLGSVPRVGCNIDSRNELTNASPVASVLSSSLFLASWLIKQSYFKCVSLVTWVRMERLL